MKRILSQYILLLATTVAWADSSTWSFVWDTSKSSGGQGFYHITSNDETTQVEELNGVEWTFQSNTSVTAYTGSAGQYFGSAKNPVIEGSLSTTKIGGKILRVMVKAKGKADCTVNIDVKVNNVSYVCNEAYLATMDTEFAEYTFIPLGEAAEGEIRIGMAQPSETRGPIYFQAMSVEYDGELADIEKKPAGLSYPIQDVTVEAGDNAFANYLENPNGVSPITYKAEDETIAIIGDNGNIFTVGKAGDTKVYAVFEGDDHYLPQTVSYNLHVVKKPVIEAPTVSVESGTYEGAIEVKIVSSDPNAKAIWYSTVAPDSITLVCEPEIVPSPSATITIDKSCTLRCVAVDYNNISIMAVREYVITKANIISLPAATGKNTEGKRLENNRIVIVRDDKKYELNGVKR